MMDIPFTTIAEVRDWAEKEMRYHTDEEATDYHRGAANALDDLLALTETADEKRTT
jgi:hypothetical protein